MGLFDFFKKKRIDETVNQSIEIDKTAKQTTQFVENKGSKNVSNKFLVFIAHVGTSELVSLYGHNTAKDMIGIDKIDWKGNLINKYPSAKSLEQMIIENDEWSHPHSGFVGNRIELNPFIVAATKHMTDKMGLSPEKAINATMITANSNITVAASDGLGHGFVVIGVPVK